MCMQETFTSFSLNLLFGHSDMDGQSKMICDEGVFGGESYD